MGRSGSIRNAIWLAVIGLAWAGTVVFAQSDVSKVMADAREALGGRRSSRA